MSNRKSKTNRKQSGDSDVNIGSDLFLTRVPDVEIEWIDYFVELGFYSSRPDFVMDAWRSMCFMLEKRVIELWSTICKKAEDPRIRASLLKTALEKDFDGQLAYRVERMHSVQVTLKLPIVLRSHLERIDNLGLRLGMKKFCKVATTEFLDEVKTILEIPEDLTVVEFKKLIKDGDLMSRDCKLQDIMKSITYAERLDMDIINEIIEESDSR